ncbi:hypothetical protein DW1_1116 [Proteiniborus sp. DW1]|uniref:DUF7694 domain-containing protein n=1 Tax=Proteiniborus sp. DW1 TaxID=1889883 RepID=UPI00092DF15F|nr:hypothetical protein [Proteiniborus sp. DW1]SCG82689.1 hypothetical protein DW1_1116 [Proteiniborus sp. DW1]
MRDIEEIKQNKRLILQEIGIDGGYGYAYLPTSKKPVAIIFSFGGGWDHVSASYSSRTPTWDEMCYIKDIFFKEDECVLQYHPPKSEYVNIHPHCLHLWRPKYDIIPKPPMYMV